MKKTVFLLLLFISTMQAQTVPKQSRLAITQNIKQNNATRIVVQDSITKELNWVLRSNLDSWTKIGSNIRNNNSGNVELILATGKKLSVLNISNNEVASINERGDIFSNFIYPQTISLFPGRGLLIGGTQNVNYFNGFSGRWQTDVPIKYAADLSAGYDARTLVDKGFADNIASGSISYLSKFTGANTLRNSSWRETSVGSRLFNATDDGFTTFQLNGSATVSNTLKSFSGYSPAITATANFAAGVQATTNGFADGLIAVSTNGVPAAFDLQSSINGNESNIAEFRDNGAVKASITAIGLATVNGLVSNDKITTTSSIKIGDDTSLANQYTAGTFRYRSLAEVGFPEIVTQDSFGNYNWRTLYHSGNLNLNNYLPITGGTLTGALNGTSGIFSGTLVNTGVATTGNIIATGTITSTGISTASAFQQGGAGFSFGNTNMQLNSGSRFLWSGDGVFTGPKDIGIARTGTAGSGVLNIMDGGTNANLRDLRLRNLFATGLNVTAGTAPASATATGTAGEIRITSTFIYYCTATNVWVRSALTTW